MNSNPITATGLVATTPRHLITTDGLPITSFRLASNVEHLNPTTGGTLAETNWLTITAFGDLAINIAGSVNKGERVVVSGNLRIRDWDNGERAGTSVEVEANSVGHDLSYGTSTFTRNVLVKNAGFDLPKKPEENLIEIG